LKGARSGKRLPAAKTQEWAKPRARSGAVRGAERCRRIVQGVSSSSPRAQAQLADGPRKPKSRLHAMHDVHTSELEADNETEHVIIKNHRRKPPIKTRNIKSPFILEIE
jgi:hypothetical protein